MCRGLRRMHKLDTLVILCQQAMDAAINGDPATLDIDAEFFKIYYSIHPHGDLDNLCRHYTTLAVQVFIESKRIYKLRSLQLLNIHLEGYAECILNS